MMARRVTPLQDLLADDLTQALMKADEVEPASLETLIDSVTKQRELNALASTLTSRAAANDRDSGPAGRTGTAAVGHWHQTGSVAFRTRLARATERLRRPLIQSCR